MPPMSRSFSSDSQKKDWSKRLSLRGSPRSKEVCYFWIWHFQLNVKRKSQAQPIPCELKASFVLTGCVLFILATFVLAQLRLNCIISLLDYIFPSSFSFILFLLIVPALFSHSGKRCKFTKRYCASVDVVATNTFATNLTGTSCAAAKFAGAFANGYNNTEEIQLGGHWTFQFSC